MYVQSVQKVSFGFGRGARRWPMYFPIRRSLPARLEPDNTFWTYSTSADCWYRNLKVSNTPKTDFQDGAYKVPPCTLENKFRKRTTSLHSEVVMNNDENYEVVFLTFYKKVI